MSSTNSPIAVPSEGMLQEFDLGLQVTADFDLQSLFPNDRLLRLHPHWFIKNFKKNELSFSADIEDYATQEKFSITGIVVYPDKAHEFMHIKLSGGLEKEILFLDRGGTLKAQVVSSHGPVTDDDPLLLWIRGIREYIRLFLKKTPITLFFRILMNRMVLKMDPSQRKISMMITKITAVEVLVIILIVVGYVLFVH
ncbi:MAG: hypothetical protein ABFR31_08955 [Thermodesulfobacteriota bacterium]